MRNPAALVLLALSAASPAALIAQPALAESQPAASVQASAARTPGDTTLRYRLEIPAQPLRDALADFARQTGLHVEAPEVGGARVRAQRVDAQLSAPEALRALLAGTGFNAVFRDAESVLVLRETARDTVRTLGTVVVTAESSRRSAYTARRTLTATKTDLPLRDVPQSVTVIGRGLLADLAVQNMADVVRYVPGVTMGQGEGHRDAPTIRGNSSTADFFVDGVRDDAQYLRDVYNAERIEALKGANAMMFGRGGGGGVINRVTKEAQWTPVRAGILESGSNRHRRGAIDVGQGIDRRLALRLNGMHENSGAFRNASTHQQTGVNPTAAILAGSALVRVGYEFFDDRRTVDRGIPSYQGRPSNAGLRTFFGDPSASRSTNSVHAASALVERGSSDGVLLRNRTRFVSYDKFYQNVYPTGLNATGTQANLAAYSHATDRTNLFNQTDLTIASSHGALRHVFLVGGELARPRTDNYRTTGYFNQTATSLAVPFERPTVVAPVSFRQSASDADNRTSAEVAAAYAQSQLSIGSHVQLLGGLRVDAFGLRFHNNRDGQELTRHDRLVSPRFGLVYKPIEAVSLYGSHSVSHLPSSGDQFASLTATTRTLEPERFTNLEVGAKWEPRADLSLTGALFQLDRTKTAAPDPADATRLVQTGRQRTTGAELGVTGNLTRAWQIAGGWATQRAVILDRTSAAREGATVPLVPHHTLSFWNRYQLVDAVGAGIGVIHQARMYAAIDNAVVLPGFTRVDAGLFLSVTPQLRAQINAENLFDERYYATSHGNNNIMPGTPRSLRVSLNVAY